MIMQGWIFPFKGFDFKNCVDILNVDFGSVGILGSRVGAGRGRAGIMNYLSYCCVSFPPLRRRNLLHRALALMHLLPL